MGFETLPKQENLFEAARVRAEERLLQGDLKGAIDGMVADLNKDPSRHPAQMSMIAMMAMDLRNQPGLTKAAVIDWIDGFAEARASDMRPNQRIHEPAPVRIPLQPVMKKEDNSVEEEQNRIDFISTFITNNKAFPPEIKAKLMEHTSTQRGPWSVKDFVWKVAYDETNNKITIYSKSGEAYIRL